MARCNKPFQSVQQVRRCGHERGNSCAFGAVGGGILLGVFETVAGGFMPHYFKEMMTFAVMMAVIVFLPNGFFGKAITKKV